MYNVFFFVCFFYYIKIYLFLNKNLQQPRNYVAAFELIWSENNVWCNKCKIFSGNTFLSTCPDSAL